MKKLLLPLLSWILLSACQGMDRVDTSKVTPQEKEAVESLLWLKQADAQRDAREGVQRGDKRLLAMATRGGHLPGIAPELTSKAKSVCGLRYLPGSTDTVMGKTHLKLLQLAEEYAENYNRIMLKQCMGE